MEALVPLGRGSHPLSSAQHIQIPQGGFQDEGEIPKTPTSATHPPELPWCLEAGNGLGEGVFAAVWLHWDFSAPGDFSAAR